MVAGVRPIPKQPTLLKRIASVVEVPAPPAFTAKEIAAEGVVSSENQLINARTNSPSPLEAFDLNAILPIC